MRLWIYNLLMWFLLPLWLVYSHRRCASQSNQNLCWQQLWSVKNPTFSPPPIWIHAVSLGETQAALIFIRALRQRHPNIPIFFTGGNRSAIEVAQKASITDMTVQFLPLDYAPLRQRLLRKVAPRCLILMETEFWPNLLNAAHQHKIPVIVLQARLSQKSKRTYPKYGQPLLSQLLSPISFIAAQTADDADFLMSLGATPNHVKCLGNIKYDLSLPQSLTINSKKLKQRIADRWIWVAGSTHPEEEIPILQAHQQLLQQNPRALLILAPRHPTHFDHVAAFLSAHNISFQRWTTWHATDRPLEKDIQVLLIDTLGILMLAYASADACFVGGSLVPWGGHNMLEPAALIKPIITGPYNHNFAEIASGLSHAQALSIIFSGEGLAQQLINWQFQPNEAQAQAVRGHHFYLSQQGATERILAAIEPYIAPNPIS
jgi:3-deoxy-D-manno-octulosonic-acid transferase